jgi:glycosyltransferase involved in cell wall biosynthesis
MTIRPGAYEDTHVENEKLIPDHVRVERAWGFDARRALAIRGRYLHLLAIPDRWQSWIAGGYLRGSTIIRNWHPDVIMSTFPVPSAHVIAYLLQRRFRLPWVAEFRDPMLQPNYPFTRAERWAYSKIENLVFHNAAKVIFTTDGCRAMYRERYPGFDAQNLCTISNGYDPVVFENSLTAPAGERTNKTVLLHSGLLYPHERNPIAFFQAVRSLSQNRVLEGTGVEFRFRASGNDEQYRAAVKDLGITKYVHFLPRLPYASAVGEMRQADALMIFQADNCNYQIPAKLYEYLYAQKPILGMVDPAGDTGALLRKLGVRSVAKLEDREQIEEVLTEFLLELHRKEAFVVPKADVERYSRLSLTEELSRVLSAAARRD